MQIEQILSIGPLKYCLNVKKMFADLIISFGRNDNKLRKFRYID